METMQAMALGEATRGHEQKVFDWNKAAELIRERKPIIAEAGLKEDWPWTGGIIYDDGIPKTDEKDQLYLASTWATPVLSLDGNSQDCYKMQSKLPDWDATTCWPNSALKILTEVNVENTKLLE